MNSTANRLRRWSRNVHRELSFFFSGMLLIYAVSGLVMNHRDTINPNYSVEQRRYVVGEPLPARDRLTRDDVVRLLAPLDEADNYTKHYFPESDVLKVFLKGGSSLTVRLSDGEAFYKKLTRRPVLGAMTRLHYNPGRWWTWFSDLFAVGLVAIVASGLLLLKGPKGLRGRGGVELAAGIAVPLLFLIFF
ncbi:PepSY-associated TM helix domain-containing protein [Alistipes communis]|jgi:membrane protein|uniref:PepSY-associated TM helix domain-containing protein n=1 Tax=Alistipes communis TaxID=2585118 RepID=UPI00242B664A|nr:PepSY-associated TM helix domain-containing protein [Alistipes communis]